MRFKIDENLPVEIAELLTDAGHDARTVSEQNLQGVKDPALVDVCNTEHRTLVTLDTDFSDIKTYPPQELSGIIVLRAGCQSKRHVIEVFRPVISIVGREPLTRHLWIVEETRIRIRGRSSNMPTS